MSQPGRLIVCASSRPCGSDLTEFRSLNSGGLGHLYLRGRSSSYVGHVVATIPVASLATRCQLFCRPIGPSCSLCRVAYALSRRTRFAMPSAALLHRARSGVRSATDCSGAEVSRWTLPRSGQHPTCVRLGDTVTW
ncbi:hypothetical protein BHE74_00049867 [Ensete ventricosum]|nr:hypothetical protein GW17_00018566 [Ensete ventricosum]RWW44371.1 hypothetical protein BHE74_00049867 [Ensete ventricosum]RZS23626.1 hypothetical protein BHM03_00056592 [Ensete ventricosum]